MTSIYLGWATWTGFLIVTVILWWAAFRDSNGGVRFMASLTAVSFSIALSISANPTFPKLHLLWIAVMLYLGSMTIAGKLINVRLKTAPARAEKESARTGEPKEAILERELQAWGYGSESDT